MQFLSQAGGGFRELLGGIELDEIALVTGSEMILEEVEKHYSWSLQRSLPKRFAEALFGFAPSGQSGQGGLGCAGLADDEFSLIVARNPPWRERVVRPQIEHWEIRKDSQSGCQRKAQGARCTSLDEHPAWPWPEAFQSMRDADLVHLAGNTCTQAL